MIKRRGILMRNLQMVGWRMGQPGRRDFPQPKLSAV